MKTFLLAAAAFAAIATPASAQSLDSKGNPFFASSYHDFIRDPVRVAVPGETTRAAGRARGSCTQQECVTAHKK